MAQLSQLLKIAQNRPIEKKILLYDFKTLNLRYEKN